MTEKGRLRGGGPSRVVIVGGGLAGLAAAAALAETGLEVQLYEARRQTGGRAGSFVDATSGLAVDYCQHVAMGCCTNLLHLIRWAGLESEFARHSRLTFLAAGTPQSPLAPSRWLPPPLAFAPGFARLRFLTTGERLQVSRGLWRLMRMPPAAFSNNPREPGEPPSDEAAETMGQWLRRIGQSEAVIGKFWNIVLASALGEDVERVAIGPARQVFVEGFLSASGAADVLVPRQPLAELFGRRLPERLGTAGVTVECGRRVRRCEIEGDGRFVVQFDGLAPQRADDLVIAVPWHSLPRLIAGSPLAAAIPHLEEIGRFPISPICGIHLWLDRPLTELEHGVIIGRMSQWIFRDPFARSGGDHEGYYYQVVVSAAEALRGRPPQEIEAEAVRDLRAIFPEAGEIRCLHSRVVSDPAAVFSIRPEVERLRPPTGTTVPGLFLAGDWVQTGWPATMEGAVRSGYRAADAIRRRHGLPGASLQGPLERSLLSRWLIAD